MAVPARAITITTRNDTAGPQIIVIGESGMPRPRMDVFAITLMPSGWFIRSLSSGFSRCETARAECANIQWNSVASVALAPDARPVGSRHNRPVSSIAVAR